VTAKHEEVAQHGDLALENFKEVEEAARGQDSDPAAKKKREKREVIVQVQERIQRRGTRVRKQVQCTSYTLVI